MQTLEVSDAVYKDVISRRVGGEAISKTLQRELKPVHKSSSLEELKRIEKGKFYKLSEI